nr:MAG TPA: hypothetical protein [Caudoviricetes sp.]
MSFYCSLSRRLSGVSLLCFVWFTPVLYYQTSNLSSIVTRHFSDFVLFGTSNKK